MKYFLLSILAAACFLAGRYTAAVRLPGLDPAPAAPVAAPTLQRLAEIQRDLDECRDRCEQTAILTGSRDLQLKACRARCDADHELPVLPRELPRSISVAPADHGR